MKYRVIEELYKGNTFFRIETRGWFFWNYVGIATSIDKAKENIRLHKASLYNADIGKVYEE